MSEAVNEQDLPGIGRRFDLETNEGGRLSVVIHHGGRSDIYAFGSRDDDEPAAVLSLGDDQARRLGAILGGAYFKPAVIEQIEAVVGGLLIDWVTLADDSRGAGRSIRELEIRRRTGMTVAAIVRDDEPILAPEPGEILQPGDRLVVIGRPEDLPRLRSEVIG